MEFIVNHDSDLQAVVIEVKGLVNSKIAVEVVLSAGAALNMTGFNKCLFDLTGVTLDPNQSMTEMFMFANVFKKANIKESVCMAAVVPSINEKFLQLERATTFEGINLKHFESRTKALAWLCA